MRYEGTIYRPPSEAYSLIIQATVGCSHNKCTFCTMYKDKKFRIRSNEDIFSDLENSKRVYGNIKRIFLADGDALIIKTENLKDILTKIKDIYPSCERVGIYGSPKSILNKSKEELKELKSRGLGIIYLGIESGNNEILKKINKGVTKEEIIEAGKRVVESGIKLSVTLISGLGGRGLWKEHATESAKVVSEINPQYVGLLTLMIPEDSEMKKSIRNGELILLTPEEVMKETKVLIENIKVRDCVFRSNHASNYFSLSGNLPEDKVMLLSSIEKAISSSAYKNEELRGL